MCEIEAQGDDKDENPNHDNSKFFFHSLPPSLGIARARGARPVRGPAGRPPRSARRRQSRCKADGVKAVGLPLMGDGIIRILPRGSGRVIYMERIRADTPAASRRVYL